MTALTVWKFDTPNGAQEALGSLYELKNQYLIEIQDAAIVEWHEGKRKPNTRQAVDLAGKGALSGAFWGMLFGLIFFIPIFGMAVGAAMGALSGIFNDYGIDDTFIQSVRNDVNEGTSALFLLTGEVTIDRVREELRGKMGTLIRSNMSREQEEKLQDAFNV